VTAQEWAAAGLYDPAAPDARERLNHLRLLDARGATLAEMVAAHRDGRLDRLAAELLFQPGLERLTAAEVAARAGVAEDLVRRLWHVAGFADAGGGGRFGARDVELVRTFCAASELFGEAAATQLLRVTASAVARIADATVSTFTSTVGAESMAADPAGGALQQANVAAAALYPGLQATIDSLLRHHLVEAARPNVTGASPRYEHSRRAVAFVDLVGSTALSHQLPLDDVAAAVQRFEADAADVVTGAGGRVVKFVGDAVMFTMTDPAAACRAALDIVDTLADDAVLAGLRGGVAFGDVVVRDGDCYGPVVNLAARGVAIARTGTVVVSDELRRALDDGGLCFEPLPPQALKGFGDAVTMHRVVRA
jgi:class 3 adenylate cyclase